MSNSVDKLVMKVVEGSVWTSKGGRDYTVLCVTNTEASKAVIDNYGIHVVFLNEKQEVFSLPIMRFVRTYEYNGLDETFGDYVRQIYEYANGQLDETGLASYKDAQRFINDYDDVEEEEEKIDLAEPVEEPVMQQHDNSLAKQIISVSEESSVQAQFFAKDSSEPIKVLSESFCGYRAIAGHQAFLFRPTNEATLQSIEYAFTGDEQTNATSCLLETNIGTSVASWDALLNVHIELLDNKTYIVAEVGNQSVSTDETEPEIKSEPQVTEEAQSEAVEVVDDGDSGVEILSTEDLMNLATLMQEKQREIDAAQAEEPDVIDVEPVTQPVLEDKIIAHRVTVDTVSDGDFLINKNPEGLARVNNQPENTQDTSITSEQADAIATNLVRNTQQ